MRKLLHVRRRNSHKLHGCLWTVFRRDMETGMTTQLSE